MEFLSRQAALHSVDQGQTSLLYLNNQAYLSGARKSIVQRRYMAQNALAFLAVYALLGVLGGGWLWLNIVLVVVNDAERDWTAGDGEVIQRRRENEAYYLTFAYQPAGAERPLQAETRVSAATFAANDLGDPVLIEYDAADPVQARLPSDGTARQELWNQVAWLGAALAVLLGIFLLTARFVGRVLRSAYPRNPWFMYPVRFVLMVLVLVVFFWVILPLWAFILLNLLGVLWLERRGRLVVAQVTHCDTKQAAPRLSFMAEVPGRRQPLRGAHSLVAEWGGDLPEDGQRILVLYANRFLRVPLVGQKTGVV
ncbi:MAG: DUF3592 domain-containing protein [Anaerolineae bacterium]|nr:DUF3592 domain-containing protein [Anaerolineae bacterium]